MLRPLTYSADTTTPAGLGPAAYRVPFELRCFFFFFFFFFFFYLVMQRIA
eukprot:NODE_4318_length_591_cov_76.601476_g3122_i0.p4 GENE.NODE_4318_length_591_cov_76.601476_g3122_i0~~NODE_4318_length_591_cov_76.601476_g3122_i0.p4  ORF type:complete len:50 (+),score=34.21 NODE_4318_length_591_cov_76.601476_g3122_i0:167-316(+)